MICLLCAQNEGAKAQDEAILDSLKQCLIWQVDRDTRLVTLSNVVRYSLYSQNDTAQYYSHLFLEEALAANDTSETARGYNLIGMSYSVRGLHEKAIEQYLNALPIYEAIKDTFMTAMVYNNIAASYQFRDKIDETLEYYEKALELFRSIPDREWEASVMFNIGEHLRNSGQLDKAIEVFKDCERTFAELGNELFLGYSLTGIGGVLISKLEYHEAIKYYMESMKHIDHSLDPSIYAMIHGNLCHCYRELGELEKADFHCAESLKIAIESKGLKEIKDAYGQNMSLAETEGNFQAAYQFSKLYRDYTDSLFSEDKDELMLNMLTKYDTEKKEKEIALKDLDISQRKEEQKFFILVIILVGLLLAAVIWIAANKSKNNKELAVKNALIGKALNEKEFLLKEIHHRVKNNLQVVSSLLSIQSRDITDQKALEAVNESRNRVKSMAIIHQNLYSEDNLTGIQLQDYVVKLCSSLFHSYKVDHDQIQLQTEVDSLLLDVDTTIPLGLILNELVSNALKYAFHGKEDGLLKVSLKENVDSLVLMVKDNGVGMPENALGKNSFGMKMIEAFAQKLHADWTIQGEDGTTVTITIKNYKKAL